MNPASSKQRSMDEYYPGSVRIKMIWVGDKQVPARRKDWAKVMDREKNRARCLEKR